ncbi:MAG: cadherin-like domain-containing protein [Lewinellaceae bacterium]|nr:cadherin-like domain-containing protein [Lewinellaceae bacterium]
MTGLSIAVDLRVYYAFYSPDSDNDEFPDCVDKCAGADDNLDLDGDGIPDACDTLDCMLTAGLDLPACPPTETAQLPAAASGQTWTALAGNPVAATVNNAGEVSGMAIEGAYYFALNDTTLGCADTVAILRQSSALGDSCNNPIFGHGVVVFDPSAGNCTLCLEADLFVDAILSTYVSLDASISLSAGTPIIGIADTLHDYPAGRRVGMVVEAVGGLIDLTLLGNFELRTYLDNNLQETATVGNSLLEAGVLAGRGNRQRLSFVTAQPFDAVVLVANALLSTIDSFRIYYAFEEPVNGCPNQTDDICTSPWLVGNAFCAGIAEERTGLTGVACVGCSINAIGNLIDDDTGNAATVTLTVGVGAAASIAVTTIQTLDETYEAGFVLSGGINLLDASVLAGLQLRTYLDGVLVDNYFANNSLISITLLGNGSDYGLVSLKPSGAFNEIRLTIYGLVNALETTQVYYAFTRKDSDLDNTPDCIDKCCQGSDDIDTDGNGNPDPCDPIADIQIQMFVSNAAPSYGSLETITLKIKNEGPSNATNLTIRNIVPTGFSNLQNISDGGVLTDSILLWTGFALPVGDSLLLSFDAEIIRYGNYLNKAEINGLNEQDIDADPNTSFDVDDLADNISDDDEDALELTPVNDPPLAADDLISTLEDTPVMIPVLDNDTDVNNDTLTISAVSDPPNGTAFIAGDSIQYIPDTNFYGQDTFQYFICDVDDVCDSAFVAVTVSPIDVRLQLKVFLQGALYNSPDTTLMRDDLRAGGHIPLLEPYSALPEFVHLNGGGGEFVSDSAEVFGDHGANSIVDWVFVELRDSANPALVVSTRAGLLQRDGDVVDVDGVSALVFEGSTTAFFHVAARHRNHLGSMTANPFPLSATGTFVDLSDQAIDLWDDGTNLDGYEQVTVWGKYALWAGNVDPNDETIFAGQFNDKDPLFNAIDQAAGNIFRSQSYQLSGYHLGDVNLSGKAIFSGQTNDVDPIFNNVDGHPRNIFKSQSFSIRQQLAQ